MKNLKNILIIFMVAFSISAISQTIDWEEISELDFEKVEHYNEFEKNIPTLIKWLESQSLDHQDRPKVNAAMLLWLEGTPNVMITLEGYVLDYTKKNVDFLMLFMAGWTKYVLENPDQKDNKYQGNLAGLNSILDFYAKGKEYGVKKDKKVKKLLKKRNEGKLEDFLSEKIN